MVTGTSFVLYEGISVTQENQSLDSAANGLRVLIVISTTDF